MTTVYDAIKERIQQKLREIPGSSSILLGWEYQNHNLAGRRLKFGKIQRIYTKENINYMG